MPRCALIQSLLVRRFKSINVEQARFVGFHIEFKQACRRKFDANGKELEANFGQTGLVRTGYLHSSYSMSFAQKDRLVCVTTFLLFLN